MEKTSDTERERRGKSGFLKKKKNSLIKTEKGSKRRNVGMRRDLMFYWFVMDQTHCVLIFDHSCNELSFSQSICEGRKK